MITHTHIRSSRSTAAIKAYKEMQAYAPHASHGSISGTYASAAVLDQLAAHRAKKKFVKELFGWITIFAVALPAGALLGYAVHLLAGFLGIR